MKQHNLFIAVLTISLLLFLLSCNNPQQSNQHHQDTLTADTKTKSFALIEPLQVGDKIELSGGYDYDPIYLRNPPASKRSGTIIQFIKGQDESPAAVVKLDQQISGQKITGDILVLELRHEGQTWRQPVPVHIELCNFMPENKVWKDRKQGEWVEAAALVILVKRGEY